MSTSSTGANPVAAASGKNASTVSDVHQLIRTRWSPRAFSERPISDADLNTILEAGRWAASSFNEQPWRFVVARKSDGPLYDRLLGILESYNQEWAKTAPVLMITAAKRTFSHNGDANLHGLHDTGAALANMMLQATALGIHTHAMAGFKREKAREELAIPEDFDLGAAVAFGYLGSPDVLSAKNRARELEARVRKPLSQLAFAGQWDNPLDLK